jgi:hypothetical protein
MTGASAASNSGTNLANVIGMAESSQRECTEWHNWTPCGRGSKCRHHGL